MDKQCARVNRWLLQANPLEPPEDLVRHVQGCLRCRGMLALISSNLVRMHPALADLDINTIDDQLPAFIDYERAHGPIAAAQAFPLVWWYLQISPAGAAAYAELVELSTIPLPLFGSTIRVRLPYPSVERPIRDIQQKLQANRYLGQAWGDDGETDVLAEEDLDTVRITLSLRRERDQQATLVVQVDPPAQGTAVIHIADLQLRATIDAQGYAIFPNLDSTLMLADANAALKVVIEPTA